MDELIGRHATLKTPYRGYRNIEIIGMEGYKYVVRICGSGAVTEFYRDEFDLD